MKKSFILILLFLSIAIPSFAGNDKLDCILDLKDISKRDSMLSKYCIVIAEQNCFDDSIKLIEYIKSTKIKSETMIEVARILYKSQQTKKAGELVYKAMMLMREIKR